jgi:hypothetical protein
MPIYPPDLNDIARSLNVSERDIVDDRPSRVETLVTLRDGTKWVIDVFETQSGRLGLTLEKKTGSPALIVDVIEKTDGSGFVIG